MWWQTSSFTYSIKMVGCLAVVTIELSHAAVITSRGLAVAVEASQVCVGLSFCRRHGEDCGIAIAVSYQAFGKSRVSGSSRSGALQEHFIDFAVLCWPGETPESSSFGISKARKVQRFKGLLEVA